MNKGLTLVETIIGISIISFSVIFMISVFTSGIMTMNSIHEENISLFLTSSKIEEISSLNYNEIEEGLFIEDFGELSDYPAYRREIEIECFDPQWDECLGGDSGMKKITVTVFSKTSDVESGIRLVSLIAKR